MAVVYANEFIPTETIGSLIIRASGVWANFHVLIATSILIALAVAYRRRPALFLPLLFL